MMYEVSYYDHVFSVSLGDYLESLPWYLEHYDIILY